MPGGCLAPASDSPDKSTDEHLVPVARFAPACSLSSIGVRKHKRVHWRVPSGGKRRPGVLDATRTELVRCLEQRRGYAWLRIGRIVAVAGYPIERALNRVRALRSDGAESLLALTVALLYLADVRTGFIGKPRLERGPWQRYTLQDLAQLAYGGQSEADVRRARRSLDMLVSLGWAFPTKQVRRYVDVSTYRSEPAVRRLNLHRLCELTGTSWLLARDRQHADRHRGGGTASFEVGRQWRKRQQQESRNMRPDPIREMPRSTGDPGSGATHSIAAILNLLGAG